ncbi:MAG TPA: SDR family NAD(P)-dependent oxidoreductase [Puia sp.]|jgi:NAD(P)-dependent dehydrogenase (short-subunit alcohol dehydrogenase family)|nr:SDR family NAD(P)-dependent oxidoreductase [Puia sp.]
MALSAFPNVVPIKMDVTNADDIRDAFISISDILAGGGLYAIINNAGITYTAPFEQADEGRAREVMEVNVMAPFIITKMFLPLMKTYSERHPVKSRVINIASWAGQVGQPFIPFYNASKAAIMLLSESMFYDLGLLGIHVVLASPGVTKTPLLEKTTEDGVKNVDGFPAEAKKFYKPYFDHYATLSKSSRDSKLFKSPEQIAKKLGKILTAAKPGFKYNLAIDAKIVDNFLTKFLPFCLRSAMNKRMFKLTYKM